MDVSIENGKYKARISKKGAELISFLDLSKGFEYIWQRDKRIWSNSAPILFPIVGRLKKGRYYYNSKEYHMDIHGFAKDSNFNSVKKSLDSLTLYLEGNETTRKQYPFSFSFYVSFSLLNHELLVEYAIKNKNEVVMPFSIGSHPGFRLPLEGSNLTDNFIEFQEMEKLSRYKIKGGLLTENGEPFLDKEKIIPLREDTFNDDALIFKGISSRRIKIRNPKTRYEIIVDTGGAPNLGIWSKPGAPYVCIEPWWGCDDSPSSTGRLEEKEGIIKLPAFETFNAYYSIKIK